jgi:hypothetical protein
MKKLLIAALASTLLASGITPASAAEYAKPSWIAETGAPQEFTWANWLPCRSDYQTTDCIEAVAWVKTDGSKVAGVWASKNDFSFANFKQTWATQSNGESAQYFKEQIPQFGNYTFEGLVTPCSDNAIVIDVRPTRYGFQLNAAPTCSGFFRAKFEERFEITVKSELKESQSKKLVVQIMEQIENIQKVLQKSNIVISKQSNIQVIDRLKKLLFGDQEVFIKDLPGMQTQAAEIQHIVDLIPNRYTVTDKADGERTFMYIIDGSIYLISNTLEVKQLDLKDMGLTKAKLEEFDSTVLDGEYIFVGSKQKFVFLGFDCLVFKGQDLRKEPKLEIRLNSLRLCTSNLFGQVSDTVQYSGTFDIEKINKYYETGIKKFIGELNQKLD